MNQHRHPPNRLLAWERLQRGWSYEEITERVRAEMVRCGETDTGLTANTVRRWETGERWPDPRYRKHLVTILGKPASELGLLTGDELALRPDTDMVEEIRRLVDVIGNGGTDRASVLRSLLGLGALPFLAPLLSLDADEVTELGGRGTPDPDSYATIVRCHQRLYWSTPARALHEAAYAHTQLGIGILRGADNGQRANFAGAVAESALLTARLAFFDLDQAAIADRCFDVALAATREAGDHSLAAAILGHMAFVPAFANQPDKARTLLAAAFQHTWHGVSPTVRSWLHCVASEVEARAGNGAASRHEIDLATSAIDSDSTAPEWLDFYDAGRLHSFAGYAALNAGDRAAAADHLTQALGRLAEWGSKQRSVVLADLASAHGDDGDRAADYLGQALAALRADWYGTGLDRVRSVRPVLGDSQHGAHLDEQITALTTSTSPAIPRR
jgi:transcriptional regulator with XRE-family HTH domain